MHIYFPPYSKTSPVSDSPRHSTSLYSYLEVVPNNIPGSFFFERETRLSVLLLYPFHQSPLGSDKPLVLPPSLSLTSPLKEFLPKALPTFSSVIHPIRPI